MSDINFNCPMCQQALEAPEEYANQVIECPACQKPITVPGPVSAAPVEAEPAAATTRCPECATEMGEGVVLCVHCGFHTKLGKKIATDFK